MRFTCVHSCCDERSLSIVLHNYRPQCSCGKVMFLHLSVILPDTPLPGQTPPGQTPPSEMVVASGGTHPTGMHSCLINVYLICLH